MIRIIFFLLTFLGSAALLVAAHLSGAWLVTSTVMADQSWIALLFSFGAFTTVLSLFFIGFEIAAFVHRKPPVVVDKTAKSIYGQAGQIAMGSYPPVSATPLTNYDSTPYNSAIPQTSLTANSTP